MKRSPVLRSGRGWCVVLSMLVAGAGTRALAAGGPAAALERLREGNERFAGASGATTHSLRSWREAARDATPLAAILSCADGVAPPELVFDSAPGEVLSVRVAGPIADRASVTSLEHAVERRHIPLLVVMGHERCDTVRAAVATRNTGDRQRPQRQDAIERALSPALDRASRRPGADDSDAALQAIVEQAVNDLVRASERLRGRVRSGDLAIVGAYHEEASGRVIFSRPVERMPASLALAARTR